MDYESFFKQRLDRLHAEGRYRVFANPERCSGFFPRVYDHWVRGEVRVQHRPIVIQGTLGKAFSAMGGYSRREFTRAAA